MSNHTLNIDPAATTSLPDVNQSSSVALDTEDGSSEKLKALPAEGQERVNQLMQEIKIGNSESVIHFGSVAQTEMSTVSDDMLQGVRNKDAGAASGLLNNMVTTIRGLDLSDVKDGKKPGFFKRLFGAIEPITKFIQQYETVEAQITAVETKLEDHIWQLSQDIVKLDKLYNASLDYFRDLEYYILAGEVRIEQFDQEDIPAARKIAEESDDIIKAQELRDIQTTRDDLERKVHDLRLTRQVVMQMLSSMRITQENDKSLINKMQSSIVNTVNMWKTQIATAITQYRARSAAETNKEVTDLNNELLVANQEALKAGNAEIKREIERGIFDIEAVEKANNTLIETIQESISIVEEGRKARADAETRLQQTEADLKGALRAG